MHVLSVLGSHVQTICGAEGVNAMVSYFKLIPRGQEDFPWFPAWNVAFEPPCAEYSALKILQFFAMLVKIPDCSQRYFLISQGTEIPAVTGNG